MIECYLLRITDGQKENLGLVFEADHLGLDLNDSLLIAASSLSYDGVSILNAKRVLAERRPKNYDESYEMAIRLINGMLGRN